MNTIQIQRLQLKHTFGLSRGSRTHVNNLFLHINNGFGEGAPVYYHGQTVEEMASIAETVLPAISNSDQSIADIINDLFVQHPNQSALIEAVDLALHDHLAKQENKPLYEYLQLSKPQNKQSSFTIGLDTKEVMLQKLEQAADYPILKIKVGCDEDLDILQTIWDTSHKPMYIDANEGWTLQQALDYLPKLEAMGVQMVEQPFKRDDLKSYEEAFKQNPTAIPIIIDEGVQGPADVQQWVGKADGVNVKLAKCGGITRALQVIEQAKKYEMKVMLGCMIESSLAVTAAAHITSLVDFIDLDGAELISNDPFDGMKFINGYIEVPNRPGIGAIPIDS